MFTSTQGIAQMAKVRNHSVKAAARRSAARAGYAKKKRK